ncbi:actin-related protein [Cryomyces antarcticus]
MTKAARDRDRALAHSGQNGLPVTDVDVEMEDDVPAEDEASSEAAGSKVIVIHPGSQNLRLGLASDALPKTVPMVIARKWQESESEEDGSEPRPKRLKLDDGTPVEPEKLFGEEFASHYFALSSELKVHMRNNKRRVLPNQRELCVNYNKRTPPDTISEHNDPLRIDWTELPPNPKDAPAFFTGQAALRIPEKSRPRYKLFWPLRYGWLNERDYASRNLLYQDYFLIIEEAIKNQLGLTRKKDWGQYDCVFVIPDLYERTVVATILHTMLRDFGFNRVCFIQESLAATFGAGYSISCIVDVGAQKTSICCVEEGMCVENSRVNLKYGGADVTETFVKTLLFDSFPYADISLKRRHDLLLAEELKSKFCTLNEADVSVQLFDFHLRAFGQDTRKYTFKTYDEGMLAPMGYFRPMFFDHSGKLEGRRRLIDRSTDLYDGSPNDPMSIAQLAVLQYAGQSMPTGGAPVAPSTEPSGSGNAPAASTPSRLQPYSIANRFNDFEGTPRSSVAGSPGPDGSGPPQPPRASTPAMNFNGVYGPQPDTGAQDRTLPIMPLDTAILTSITEGARGDERKMRDFLGGIMVIGGGAKIPGFNALLEERLRAMQPGFLKEILIGPPPRELDPQVVVWKGGSVFGKLRATNDSWIGGMEYDRLGARLLNYKCMWVW